MVPLQDQQHRRIVRPRFGPTRIVLVCCWAVTAATIPSSHSCTLGIVHSAFGWPAVVSTATYKNGDSTLATFAKLVPLFTVMVGSSRFGWLLPVPVDMRLRFGGWVTRFGGASSQS